jgi:hypothetical protein
MNLVSLLPDEKRKAVNNWLLGVTTGSYCFGAAFVSFGRVHLGRDPLLFVVPGMFVGLLDFVQIHSLRLVERAPLRRALRGQRFAPRFAPNYPKSNPNSARLPLILGHLANREPPIALPAGQDEK